MSGRSNILVLYTELMGYTEATLEALARLSGSLVTAVQRDTVRTRGYVPKGSERLHLLPRSKFDRNSLLRLYDDLAPQLIFVAGWQDPDYLAVARVARKRGLPVITGMDNQWSGSMRQHLACLAAPLRVRPYFSHIQVAGLRQYEYARRLGYAHDRILLNEYSADTTLFSVKAATTGEIRTYPPRLLYVGRLHQNKGLDVLAKAWRDVGAASAWELQLIGNGGLGGELGKLPRVTVKEFLQPEALAKEACGGGAFVLPSRREPWGVVVHEFAAAGLPLILSSACGAATEFLIPGYNGFVFRNEDPADLARCFNRLFTLTEPELRAMGARSAILAKRISSETAAANILSVLSVPITV
jgi:glycosyltransferase involved in cell wall biosynthesis